MCKNATNCRIFIQQEIHTHDTCILHVSIFNRMLVIQFMIFHRNMQVEDELHACAWRTSAQVFDTDMIWPSRKNAIVEHFLSVVMWLKQRCMVYLIAVWHMLVVTNASWCFDEFFAWKVSQVDINNTTCDMRSMVMRDIHTHSGVFCVVISMNVFHLLMIRGYMNGTRIWWDSR